MSQHATFDDANLILRLYEIRREERLREARRWFARNFGPATLTEYRAICTPGTDEDEYVRMVISYYEMVASFITKGVLSTDLYFATGGELGLVYSRLEPVLAELRAATGHPGMYKNLEIVARQYGEYLDAQAPGNWEGFKKRTRGMILAK
jgi:hypothetical protein